MRSLHFALAALSLSTLCSVDPTDPLTPADGGAPTPSAPPVPPVPPAPPAPPAPPIRADVAGAQSILLAAREVPFELVSWPENAPPEKQTQLALVRVSSAVKGTIVSAATHVEGGLVKFNVEKQRALALIASLHTVSPGGKPLEPVFRQAHLKELLSQPAGEGSLVDILGARAVELMDVQRKEALAEAKND